MSQPHKQWLGAFGAPRRWVVTRLETAWRMPHNTCVHYPEQMLLEIAELAQFVVRSQISSTISYFHSNKTTSILPLSSSHPPPAPTPIGNASNAGLRGRGLRGG